MAVSGEFVVAVGIVVGAGAINADLPGVLVLHANIEFKAKTRCGGAGALPSVVFSGLRNCSAQKFQGGVSDQSYEIRQYFLCRS